MTSIRIASPEGPILSRTRTLAKLPADLTGRRLAVLSNGKHNARLLLTTLRHGSRRAPEWWPGP